MIRTVNPGNMNWLMLSLGLVIVPHVPYLPAWIYLTCASAGLWRLYASHRGSKLPSKWLLGIGTLAALVGVFTSFGTLLGRDASIALLIVMIALKMLEMKTLRDGMVLLFMGYFLVITNFLYSQSIPTGIYMVASVLITTATMISLNHHASAQPWKWLRLAATLLGQAIPLMLLLFLLFPRVNGPLWGKPSDTFSGRSGLNDRMAPGTISQLSLSGDVAFRVAFDGSAPPPHARYWRGPVLNRFDGRTWSAGRPFSSGEITFQGNPIGYTVMLEPNNRPWLLALDLPASVPPAASMTGAFQLISHTPVRQRLRYHVYSQINYVASPILDPADKWYALQLPPRGNPRARDLAISWRADGFRGRGIVNRALAMFRDGAFSYTLTPPPLGDDAVDDFLFNTRRGFCEHYASSFVFLMRAAGIPARVVIGYQGGEFNPMGNYLIVRQSDAHAWAEVWLEREGWVRVDPTAAVAPQRIESGIANAVASTDPLPVFARVDILWLRQFGLALDSLNNSWNQWVLGYGQDRQMMFLSRTGLGLESWKGMIAWLVVTMGMLLAAFAAIMLWRMKTKPVDPIAAIYQRFCYKLARHGLIREGHEGPAAFADRVVVQHPEWAPEVRRVTQLYIGLRYGLRSRTMWLPHLRKAVRSFRI